jgi:N-acetylmuramoyl-L-alanine amidase
VNVIDLVNDLPKGKKAYPRRALSMIDCIVVHHSATLSGSPKAFADYHVKHNKWPGIGYHYVIGKAGEVWMTNTPDTISYHATGYNSRSIGVCMVGNFDQQPFGGAQKTALLALLRYLLDVYPGVKFLLGHYETGAKKSCPGKHVDMDELRKALGVQYDKTPLAAGVKK